MRAEMSFQIGQTVTWIGTRHMFERSVSIVAKRQSIMNPDDIVYDIHDATVIKGTIYSIPESQLIGNCE
jgi:hypothetical protein